MVVVIVHLGKMNMIGLLHIFIIFFVSGVAGGFPNMVPISNLFFENQMVIITMIKMVRVNVVCGMFGKIDATVQGNQTTVDQIFNDNTNSVVDQ